jgi:parallel beta-helix repeat protein
VHVNPAYGAGGFKTGKANGITVAYNTVHDDDGGGLWSDVASQHVTYHHNTVYNETRDCIRLEISHYQTVISNTVYNCGTRGGGAAGINFVCSSNGDIEYNTVTAIPGAPGIAVGYQSARNWEHPDFTAPENMTVAHNSITIGSGVKAVTLWDFSSPHDASWQTASIYNSNNYCVPTLDWTESSWGKGDGFTWGTFMSWQDKAPAQDAHGQLSTLKECPTP